MTLPPSLLLPRLLLPVLPQYLLLKKQVHLRQMYLRREFPKRKLLRHHLQLQRQREMPHNRKCLCDEGFDGENCEETKCRDNCNIYCHSYNGKYLCRSGWDETRVTQGCLKTDLTTVSDSIVNASGIKISSD